MTGFMRSLDDVTNDYKSQVQLILENMKKIKEHSSTKIIKYPQQKEAFDYVDILFPKCNVKEAVIYKTNYTVLKKLGYGFAEGFYSRLHKIVVICDKRDKVETKKQSPWSIIRAKISQDEVIVHELLHYCSDKQDNYTTSRNIEEEFAYGHSIAYMRKKGYSDDKIIKDNFLPYLVSTVNDFSILKKILNKHGYSTEEIDVMSKPQRSKLFKKYEQELVDEIVKEATKTGQEIIRIYSDKKISNNIIVETGNQKLDFMDLD
jgi:uncharacterized protein YifE (UPF0438 family)